MNTSKLLVLVGLGIPLTACGGAVASPDAAPASAGAVPSSTTTADWSCTEPGAPLPSWTHPAALGSQDTLAVHVVEAYSHAGVGGVTVRACAAPDVTCSSPIDEALADDAGVATLTIHGGQGSFDGYLEVSGPGLPPNLVFFDGRTSAQDGFFDAVVYTPAALGFTATLAGVTLDSRRGVLRVEARDCAGAPAAGVSLTLGSSGGATPLTYFASDGSLLPDAHATDGAGVAVAFGVAERSFGVHEAVGPRAVGGALGFARAGAISSVVALP